jgi:pimeloyl-ACP methyl ester carboxylesterase
MARLEIPGGSLEYYELGSGTPVVLTPGGRWAGYVQRVVATELAKDYRVITWDRRNSNGASSLVLESDRSEAEIWADDLALLIRELRLAPCYLGEYAGCRTSPLVCMRYPELVKGLMLAWPSGGEKPAQRVPRVMYQTYTRAALRSGMKGVTETRHFSRSIELNPANREALLARDPTRFVRQMAYWQAFFNTTGDLPIAGCVAGDEEWASIRCPSIVTGGCDPIHPTEAAQRLHRLIPGSQYHDPVIPQEEFLKVFGVEEYPVVSDLQGARIAPVWRDFIAHTEKQSS